MGEGIGFDFEPGLWMCGAGAVDHLLKGGGIEARGEVVVLHEKHVVEAHAVVASATGGGGLFFQGAEAGCGFACVQNFGSGSSDGFDIAAGESGDA